MGGSIDGANERQEGNRNADRHCQENLRHALAQRIVAQGLHAATAERLITMLSDLLRLSFAGGDAAKVPLAEEMAFVRRYLEHNPQLPLSLRQVDPLIRQLTLYRDLIESRTQNSKQENPS